METSILNKKTNLRFRRWSRANFAIFSSLGKELSIGALNVDLNDSSLQKHQDFGFFVSAENMIADCNLDSADLLEEIEADLLQYAFLETNVQTLAAASCEGVQCLHV